MIRPAAALLAIMLVLGLPTPAAAASRPDVRGVAYTLFTLGPTAFMTFAYVYHLVGGVFA